MGDFLKSITDFALDLITTVTHGFHATVDAGWEYEPTGGGIGSANDQAMIELYQKSIDAQAARQNQLMLIGAAVGGIVIFKVAKGGK